MNLATVIVLLVVAACVVVAVYYLRKGKGKSSCCGSGKPAKGCAGCIASCPLKR